MHDERIRVLLWTHEFWPSIGGGQVITTELARGLQARGYLLRARRGGTGGSEMLHDGWEKDGLGARALRRSARVACCSRAVLEELRHRVPGVEPRSSVILNGLPSPDGEPSPVAVDPPVLLCVGRLTEPKGFDVAIAALARVRASHPDARLVIAGDGPARDGLGRLAGSLGVSGAVELTGWIAPPRVPDAMARATLVIVPSRGPEAFGLVALQAGQSGRHGVAARVGGLPEVVRDGLTGVLVAPDDPEALARALVDLLDDPDRMTRMGRTARSFVRERFGAERFVNDYDALYRRPTSPDVPVTPAARSTGRSGRRG